MFACVGWKVTLCDPIRQVTLRIVVRWISINSYTHSFFPLVWAYRLSTKTSVSTTESLFVPAVRLSTVGRRAFPVADARIFDDLYLRTFTSSPYLLTFLAMMKNAFIHSVCPIPVSLFICADCKLFSLWGP